MASLTASIKSRIIPWATSGFAAISALTLGNVASANEVHKSVWGQGGVVVVHPDHTFSSTQLVKRNSDGKMGFQTNAAMGDRAFTADGRAFGFSNKGNWVQQPVHGWGRESQAQGSDHVKVHGQDMSLSWSGNTANLTSKNLNLTLVRDENDSVVAVVDKARQQVTVEDNVTIKQAVGRVRGFFGFVGAPILLEQNYNVVYAGGNQESVTVDITEKKHKGVIKKIIKAAKTEICDKCALLTGIWQQLEIANRFRAWDYQYRTGKPPSKEMLELPDPKQLFDALKDGKKVSEILTPPTKSSQPVVLAADTSPIIVKIPASPIPGVEVANSIFPKAGVITFAAAPVEPVTASVKFAVGNNSFLSHLNPFSAAQAAETRYGAFGATQTIAASNTVGSDRVPLAPTKRQDTPLPLGQLLSAAFIGFLRTSRDHRDTDEKAGPLGHPRSGPYGAKIKLTDPKFLPAGTVKLLPAPETSPFAVMAEIRERIAADKAAAQAELAAQTKAVKPNLNGVLDGFFKGGELGADLAKGIVMAAPQKVKGTVVASKYAKIQMRLSGNTLHVYGSFKGTQDSALSITRLDSGKYQIEAARYNSLGELGTTKTAMLGSGGRLGTGAPDLPKVLLDAAVRALQYAAANQNYKVVNFRAPKTAKLALAV